MLRGCGDVAGRDDCFFAIGGRSLGAGIEWRAVTAAFRGVGGPLLGSMGTAIVSSATALLLGIPFALVVERSRAGLRRTCWTLGLLVLIVPPYIVSEAWKVLFGPAGKISRPIATLLGFGPHSSDPITVARFAVPGFVYTWPAVGAVMGACFFPIVALAVASAYRRTDHRVLSRANRSGDARSS